MRKTLNKPPLYRSRGPLYNPRFPGSRVSGSGDFIDLEDFFTIHDFIIQGTL